MVVECRTKFFSSKSLDSFAELVVKAVEAVGYASDFASVRLQNDKELATEAIKQKWACLRTCSHKVTG